MGSCLSWAGAAHVGAEPTAHCNRQALHTRRGAGSHLLRDGEATLAPTCRSPYIPTSPQTRSKPKPPTCCLMVKPHCSEMSMTYSTAARRWARAVMDWGRGRGAVERVSWVSAGSPGNVLHPHGAGRWEVGGGARKRCGCWQPGNVLCVRGAGAPGVASARLMPLCTCISMVLRSVALPNSRQPRWPSRHCQLAKQIGSSPGSPTSTHLHLDGAAQ